MFEKASGKTHKTLPMTAFGAHVTSIICLATTLVLPSQSFSDFLFLATQSQIKMSFSKYQQRQPLPDLCLLAIIEQLDAEDRMAALKVCPRWFYRVREANRAVPSLTIAVGRLDFEKIDKYINNNYAASEPSVKLLKKTDGSQMYPLHHSTNWNCLLFKMFDSIPVKAITTTFPHVNELIFVNSRIGKEYMYWVKMLQSEEWRDQLTALQVIDWQYPSSDSKPLFTAINALKALRKLTLNLEGLDMHHLPIISQLEEIRFNGYSRHKQSFLHSLQQYATSNNSDLKVYFVKGKDHINKLINLNEHLRGCVARVSDFYFSSSDLDLLSLATKFPSLTSLALEFPPSFVHQLFTALSTLEHLFHLALDTDFSIENTNENEQFQQPISPRAQLKSVKALDLRLTITSHSDLQWLNLPVTMPNLQAIYILGLNCKNCDVDIWQFQNGVHSTTAKQTSTRQCLRAVFGILSQRVFYLVKWGSTIGIATARWKSCSPMMPNSSSSSAAYFSQMFLTEDFSL